MSHPADGESEAAIPSERDVLAMARSSSVFERGAAADLLARLGTPAAYRELETLLYYREDIIVPRAAAAALLRTGPRGWDAVLAAVWRSEEVGVTEAFRAVFTDQLLAGVDVESELRARVRDGTSPRSPVVLGAKEMLMGLDYLPIEYLGE